VADCLRPLFRTAIDRRERTSMRSPTPLIAERRIADRRFALAFGRLEIGARSRTDGGKTLILSARLVAEFGELSVFDFVERHGRGENSTG